MVVKDVSKSQSLSAFRVREYPLSKDSHLQRVLGLSDVISFGVSSTIGSGIFVSVGYIARFITGPSLPLSFVLVVAAVLLAAFCFAEFAGIVHSAGIGYSYAYTSYGELVAFVIGILTFFSYTLGTAAVARGWADYVKCFIHAASGYEIPSILTEFRLNDFLNISALAPVLCLGGAYIAITGMKESAWVGNTLVLINLSIMAGFVIYGLAAHADSSNLSPLFLPEVGWMGILKGSGLAFFCMVGWDLTCSLSDETINSYRTLPRGIVGTLIIVGLVYCCVSFTLCAIVPSTSIDIQAPVATAFRTLGDNWMYLLVSFAAVTVTSANVLTGSTGPPRIIYSIAQDGLLPACIGRIDPRSGVPRNATIVCALLNILACTFFDFTSLASITSCFALLVYAIVCGGLIVLRLKNSRGIFTNRFPMMIALAIFMVCSLMFQFRILSIAELDQTLMTYGIANLTAFVLVVMLYRSSTRARVVSELKTQPLLEDSPVTYSTFRCPWVPVVPLMAMWINTFMIASLGVTTLVWALVVIGICSITYLIMHH